MKGLKGRAFQSTPWDLGEGVVGMGAWRKAHEGGALQWGEGGVRRLHLGSQYMWLRGVRGWDVRHWLIQFVLFVFFFPTAANLCTEKNSLNQHRTHIKVRSSLIEFSFLERSRRKGLKRKREQEAQHFTFYACWSQFQVFLSKIFMSILPSKEVSTRKLLKFKSAHCDHTYHFTYRKPKYNKEMIVAQRTQIWTG